MNASVSPNPSAAAAREPREPREASSADRQRFDSAIRRAAERRGANDNDDGDDAAPADAQATPAPLAFALPLDATPAALGAIDGGALARGMAGSPALSLDQFAASLSQLQAPADAQGVQQWQFSLSERSVPLAGVQLHAVGAGPWQVTLQSSSRDRQMLHSHIDKLRDRLRSRGAAVGEVRIGEAGAPGDE